MMKFKRIKLSLSLNNKHFKNPPLRDFPIKQNENLRNDYFHRQKREQIHLKTFHLKTMFHVLRVQSKDTTSQLKLQHYR